MCHFWWINFRLILFKHDDAVATLINVNILHHKPFDGMTNEQCHEKTCLQGFLPGLTQTGLYDHIRCLET